MRGSTTRGCCGVAVASARPVAATVSVSLSRGYLGFYNHAILSRGSGRSIVTSSSSSSSSSSTSSSSETACSILQMLEEQEAKPHQNDYEVIEGRVLSSAAGLLRVALPGPVAVGHAVEYPDGLGVVLRFDKRGAIVGTISGRDAGNGDMVTVKGFLGLQPLTVVAAAQGQSAVISPISDLLKVSGSSAASSIFSLPAMPLPTQRQPIRKRLQSGITAAEALLPPGEGHRVLLVGPPTTGKSTALGMLLESQNDETAIVFASQRSLNDLKRSIGGASLQKPNLHIVHADNYNSAVARYLVPLAAFHMANNLRSSHRHVLLVLDDLVTFAQASAALGVTPIGAPQLIAAALDSAGVLMTTTNARGEGGQEHTLSVVVVADLDPDDDELHSTSKQLWRTIEPSVDISLNFDLKLASEGIMPAVDIEKLLVGPAPVYQAPFFKLLRTELLRALTVNRDRRERLEIGGQLGLHKEPQDLEDMGSARVARMLFAQRGSRSSAENAILLTASLVYHFPLNERTPSRTAVSGFQEAVVTVVREGYPDIWGVLERVETLNETEAQALLQHLGKVLISHRFDFQLTSSE